MIKTGQSSNNYGLLNYDSKTGNNYNDSATCSCSWVDEIPEIIGALLILVFVWWFRRKWMAYKCHLAIRRAVTGPVAVQTVAGTLARKDYSYLDN